MFSEETVDPSKSTSKNMHLIFMLNQIADSIKRRCVYQARNSRCQNGLEPSEPYIRGTDRIVITILYEALVAGHHRKHHIRQQYYRKHIKDHIRALLAFCMFCVLLVVLHITSLSSYSLRLSETLGMRLHFVLTDRIIPSANVISPRSPFCKRIHSEKLKSANCSLFFTEFSI